MSRPANRPDLSLVILGYRSEERLVPVVEDLARILDAQKLDYEIILVANFDAGSEDRTPAIARMIGEKNVRCRYLAEQKNGFMGWDLRRGLAVARGDYIAFVDGDGQIMPEDVMRVYHFARAGNLDLAKVFRKQRGDSLWRKILSKAFNIMFSCFFPGISLRDINAKPKVLTRRALESMKLSSDDWFADAEILLEAKWLGLKTGEIPGVTLENRWRKSYVRFAAVFEFIGNIIKYRIRYWFLR